MSYGGPTKQFPWALPEAESRPCIQQALEFGINFFDTANVYNEGNSEKVVDQVLRDFAQRDDYALATKVFNPVTPPGGPNQQDLSRKHILSAIDASLTRLGRRQLSTFSLNEITQFRLGAPYTAHSLRALFVTIAKLNGPTMPRS